MTDAIIKSEHNRALETKVYAFNGTMLLIIWQELHKFSLISGKVAAQSWENLCHPHQGTNTAGFSDLSLIYSILREKTAFMQ